MASDLSSNFFDMRLQFKKLAAGLRWNSLFEIATRGWHITS